MMRFVTLLILFCLPFFAIAEELRYNVALHQGNMQDKPFELYKGTTVRMGKPNAAAQCQVRATVFIPVEKVLYGYKIMKDCPLYNEEMEITGRITGEMILYRPLEKDSLHWKIELDGWLYTAAIDPASVPEFFLEGLMQQQYPQTYNNLALFIRDFGFKAIAPQSGFTAYELEESHLDVNDMGIRMRLVFYKGELAAVIHSRPLQLRKFEGVVRNELELIFTARIDEDLKNEIKHHYYDPLL